MIGGSALVGLLAATMIKRSWSIYVAGAVPWFALLAALIYTEYFTPYKGGGASMWLVAQVFGGTIAAVTGVVSYKAAKKFAK